MKKILLLLITVTNISIAQQHRLDSISTVYSGDNFISEVSRFVYNSNNDLTQIKELYYDSDNNHWHYPNTIDFEYNSNHDIIKDTYENAIYDSNDLLTLEKEKVEYSYNSNNQINEIIRYRWVNGQWNYFHKTVKDYSNNNQLMGSHRFAYQNNNWTPQGYSEIYSQAPHKYATFSNNGDTMHLYEEFFNLNNKISQSVSYNFHSSSQLRYPPYKDTYTYNSDSQLETVRMYNDITPFSELRFEYESGVSYSDVIADVNTSIHFSSEDGKVLKFKFYDFNNGNWDLNYQETYHYQTLTSIVENKTSDFFIYPNPVKKNNKVSIIFKQEYKSIELRIIDALGRTVISEKQRNVSKKEKLPTKNLEKGIYFISIKVNNELLTEKLIIE